MQETDIENANKLYDTVEDEMLFIDGWDDDGNVSVTTPNGVSVMVEDALSSDRYVPIKH